MKRIRRKSKKKIENEKQNSSLLEIFWKTVFHFFPQVDSMFDTVHDQRDQNRIDYTLAELLFIGILLFVFHLKARRQIHHQLRDPFYQECLLQNLGIEDVPHGDTVNYCFKKLSVEECEDVRTDMIRRLIRMKSFDQFRLLDRYILIAIDGTRAWSFRKPHCPYCMTQTLDNGKTIYYHPVLEAKWVMSNGLSFSIATEFIENTDPNRTKQDCEINAMYRLLPKIKKAFPQLSICLLLDGIFANQYIITHCENYRWKYIITLKDGSLKTVNREFHALIPLQPENKLTVRYKHPKPLEQQYQWVTNIEYQNYLLTVLQCIEYKDNTKTLFRWITNLPVTIKNVEHIANGGGRLRWKIENEGFKNQKNGGYELQHAYSKNNGAMKIFYVLLQIAHMLLQLVEGGSLFKKRFPKGLGSKENIARRLLEEFKYYTLKFHEYQVSFKNNFQIRFEFDSS